MCVMRAKQIVFSTQNNPPKYRNYCPNTWLKNILQSCNSIITQLHHNLKLHDPVKS